MVIMVFGLALAMIVAGATAAFYGAQIIMVERGWSMLIAGSTIGSAGAILLGLAMVIRLLERTIEEREGSAPPRRQMEPSTTDARAAPPHLDPPPALEPAGILHAPDPPRVPMPPPAPPAPPHLAPAPPTYEDDDDDVVGRHESGGNSYVMYADGSVEARMPTGHHRFASLDALKAFLANGEDAGTR